MVDPRFEEDFTDCGYIFFVPQSNSSKANAFWVKPYHWNTKGMKMS